MALPLIFNINLTNKRPADVEMQSISVVGGTSNVLIITT